MKDINGDQVIMVMMMMIMVMMTTMMMINTFALGNLFGLNSSPLFELGFVADNDDGE